MKKVYTEPTNTVVKLNPVNMIADSIENVQGLTGFKRGGGSSEGGVVEAGGREAIDAPDAWDEW